MSLYFEKLKEKLKNRYNLKPDVSSFKGIVGARKWLTTQSDSTEILDILAEKNIPFLAISENNVIKLFDFEDKYLAFANNHKVRVNKFYSKLRYPDTKFWLYSNYNLFGGLDIVPNRACSISFYDIIESNRLYQLDYAVWVSEISIELDGPAYVVLTLAPKRFVFKGPFLEHYIPWENDSITISFLALLLKIIDRVRKRACFYFKETLLFANKKPFFEFYEKVIFPKICRIALNTEYIPPDKNSDIETRLRKMIEFLNKTNINADDVLQAFKNSPY